MKIPLQLQNPAFRFVRLKWYGWQEDGKPLDLEACKRPIPEETGWRLRGGLSFDSPVLLDHIERHKNYGISGGYGNLYLLDSDIPLIGELIEQKFGQTFRVRSGSGRGFHDYFIIRSEKLYRTITFDKDDKHYGELRGDGNYVVCPGSVHPSGGVYEVIRDLPILEIEYDLLVEYLKDYTRKTDSHKIKSEYVAPSKDYGESDIQSISLSTVLGTTQHRIANPWHGSTTGQNMVVDYSKNVWHCKRCDAGGGVAQAIALNEGIISSCSDRLSTEDFFQVLKVARDKYGLKIHERSEPVQPKGWARCLSITTIANEYDFKACPNCGTPLKFRDDYGSYQCKPCGIHGGIKAFMMMCLRHRRKVSP